MAGSQRYRWIGRALLGGALLGIGGFHTQLTFSAYEHLRTLTVDLPLVAGILFLDVLHAMGGALAGLAILALGRAVLSKWTSARRRLGGLAWRGSVALATVATVAVVVMLSFTDDDFERGPDPAALARRDRPNVVLLVADSLRRDALDDPERLRTLAPNLARIQKESTDYTSHQTVSSWTPPSMAGLLTGRYPAEIQAHTGQLDDRFDTLAERLLIEGYETAGVSDNYLTNSRFGFDQGHQWYWQKNNCVLFSDLWFSHWRFFRYYEAFFRYFRYQYRGAAEVNVQVQRWFEGRDRDRPFYLMVHYMDTHYPFYVYDDEPENESNLSTNDNRVTYHEALLRLRQGPKPPFAKTPGDPAEREDFLHRYRGSLQYLDRHVGELVSWLRQSGEWDNTLLVFTADHGEEFFDHSYIGHGRTLYQESTRVPLMVKWPAGFAVEAGTVDTPVSLLQVMPTILAWTQAEPPGEDLLPPLPVEAGSWAPVFSEFDRSGIRIVGGRFDRFKLIYTQTRRGRELLELYDLREDPAETVNLQAEASILPNAVLVAFHDFVERVRQPDASTLPAETLQELRSLGYVQ